MATVGEVMSRNLLTVEPTTGLSEAAERMSDRGVGAALVLSGESVSGILTERDVLRAVATGPVEGTHVAAWMTREPSPSPLFSATRSGDGRPAWVAPRSVQLRR